MNSQTLASKSLSPQVTKVYWQETVCEFKKLLRSPSFALPTLLFPVMFYVFFGVIFSMNQNMPTYLLATYGAFGVIGPALFSFGVGVAIERSQGWFTIKEISPMPAGAYLFARIIVSVIFALMVVILLFTLGATLGDVRLISNNWMLLAGILILGSLPFCAMGLSLGLLLSANSAPAVVNLIYLPMAFLSGLWMPINFFPEAMQVFANFLPAYHLSQLALGVVDLSKGQSVYYHIICLAVFFIIFSVIALLAYKRKDKN